MDLIKGILPKVQEFIFLNARKLDKTLFLYEFGNQQADLVFVELLKYQNVDGGFGNALEPDIRMTESSPIATTVAFQYINEIKALIKIPDSTLFSLTICMTHPVEANHYVP